MNSVNLIGRLTKDPEVKYSSSQMAVCKVTLAVDRQTKDKGADFIPVTFFGKTAENLERFKKKGEMVAIQGHIQTGSYEKDGHNVYTFDVIVDRLEFVGSTSPKTDDFSEDNNKNGKYINQENKASQNRNLGDTPKGFSTLEEEIPF